MDDASQALPLDVNRTILDLMETARPALGKSTKPPRPLVAEALVEALLEVITRGPPEVLVRNEDDFELLVQCCS